MIEVKDLVFSYPGQDKETIKKISFNIKKGEIYGFLGPSGAGKSTTQKILTRLLSKYQGSAKVLDKELSNWKNDYFYHIGVGFELPNHYTKLTGLENLKMFTSLYGKQNKHLMDLFEMVGLQDAAKQKVSDYSKGMKMRLNFIRALAHDPEILFFDEPTSGLDPGNATNLKKIIRNLKSQGKTIFLTTHNMHDADELCDRVAFITDGVIKQEDTPKNLKLRFGQPKLNVEYQNGELKNAQFNLEDLGNNTQFIEIIKNTKIVSIHSCEASLDEVFIKTTGKNLI
jgi:fluoroquinolone transport system ATP-binding protein